MLDILVLGGTRFLGRYLVEAALERGHTVTLFNRGNNRIFPNVEQLVGDRDGHLAALKGRKWDAVIDTCGFIPRTVLNVIKTLNPVKHYTYISSISAYKALSEVGVDESGEVHTMSDEKLEEITKDSAGPFYNEYYGPLKVLSEEAAENELPGKVLVVRAGQLVGPHDYTDRLPYWVKRVSEGGTILAPGRKDRQIQIIDSRDLADWIIKMVEENVTGIFNATGPDYTLTMEKFLEECKKVCASDATFRWVSEQYLKEKQVGPWGEMPLWIPEEFPLEGEEKPLKGFLAVDIQKAIDKGLTFRPLSETLNDVLVWETTREDGPRKAGLDRQKEIELLTNTTF
jgi:2'-hydroxyisoflavone reductase